VPSSAVQGRQRHTGARNGKGVTPAPHQPTSGSGGALYAPPAGSGAEPRPQMHFGEFLAHETFLMATIFTILVYERRDKIVGNTLQESFVRLSTPPDRPPL